jgi:hypothetical protein
MYEFRLGMETKVAISPMAHATVVFLLWPQPSACPKHLTSVLRELLLSKTGVTYG